MTFYSFPHITRIEPVLEAIKDSDDFRVTEKEGGYKVINYNLASSTTFPQINPDQWYDVSTKDYHNAIRRECRGLIFDADGNLIRRAYHKFFNLGEREETMVENVNFSEPHCVLEKIDGSMVTPLWLPDDSTGEPHLRLATKAGITDVSMEAEVFISDKPWYKEFMRLAHEQNLCPIFEYVSPETRIVIRHKEPNLILTAIRNMITGDYFPYYLLRVNGLHANIPVVERIYNSIDNVDRYVSELERQSDTEGVVIRFDSGHMVKVKTLWYVAIHRAKDNLLHEKRVIELILNEKADDVLPFLDHDDRIRLEEYQEKLVTGLHNTIDLIRDHYYPKAKSGTRKDFALGLSKEIPWAYSNVIFSCWEKDREAIEETVIENVKRSLTSQAKIDATRHLWGNAVWSYKGVEE